LCVVCCVLCVVCCVLCVVCCVLCVVIVLLKGCLGSVVASRVAVSRLDGCSCI
jgi:hypothetical protein